MEVFEIPLTPTPQRFTITMAGKEYALKVRWNPAMTTGWVLDIGSPTAGAIVSGIPLVTGDDLLAQYPDKGFGVQLIVQTDHDTDAVPTFDNLGETSNLFFIVGD